MTSPIRAGLTAAFVYLYAAGVSATALGGFFWALTSLTFGSDAFAIGAGAAGALLGCIVTLPLIRTVWRFERRGEIPGVAPPAPDGTVLARPEDPSAQPNWKPETALPNMRSL